MLGNFHEKKKSKERWKHLRKEKEDREMEAILISLFKCNCLFYVI
jgi:hypothetical protein